MKRACTTAMILVLVAAFAFGGGEQETAGAAGGQPVELRATYWFAAPANMEAVENATAEFNEEFPNATAVAEQIPYDTYWQKIPAMAAAGQLPDIVQIATILKYTMGPTNALYDLQEFIDNDPEMMRAWADYLPGAKEAVKYEGQIIQLPYGYATSVLLYNREAFDEAGLDYPGEEYTWDDLLEDAQALTKRDENGIVTQWGFYKAGGMEGAHSGGIQNFILQNGGTLMNEEGTEAYFDSAEAIEAVHFINDMINTYEVMPSPTEAEGLGDLFEAGKAAIAHAGSWLLPQYKKACDFDWDINHLPTHLEAAAIGDVGGAGFSMAKNTEAPELAWEYLKKLNNYMAMHNARSGGEFPGDADLFDMWIEAEGPPYNRQNFADWTMTYGVARQITPGYLQWRRELGDEMVLIFNGEKSVEQGMQDANRKINRILREQN